MIRKGKKIVLLSKVDNAASGYRLAEAVNLTTNNFVEYIVLYNERFPPGLKKRPTLYEDSPIPLPKTFRDPKRRGWKVFSDHNAARIQTLVDDADIIHFKGDDLPVDDFIHSVRIPRNKPRIVTVSGSFFRRSDSSLVSMPVAEISEYVKLTDFRSAMTPDLNYPEFDALFTQQTMDTTTQPNKWTPQEGKLVFAHSPSQRAKKGTEQFLEAINILQRSYPKIEVDLLEGLDYAECLKKKHQATVFFDQSIAGFYGNSAIEAMAAGIPTACNISQQAKAQSDGKINEDCPIINCGDTVSSMVEAFGALMDSDLETLSLRTKQWTDAFHSYEAVGTMWGEIYRNL